MRRLAGRPHLAERVVDLPAVSEVEKRWLYGRTAAVLYPSLYEGFGLVPFEAADYGVPCLWAPVTAMAAPNSRAAKLNQRFVAITNSAMAATPNTALRRRRPTSSSPKKWACRKAMP